MPEIIRHEIINKHYNNLLTSYFRIKKIRKLVAKKYFEPTLRKDMKGYIKGCDMCLAFKIVKHKPYKDL